MQLIIDGYVGKVVTWGRLRLIDHVSGWDAFFWTVAREIYHQQPRALSQTLAGPFLDTMTASDFWTFILLHEGKLINLLQCEKRLKTYISTSSSLLVLYWVRWRLLTIRSQRNCCIYPNGLGRGHLEYGRAPRLSLCHLPLCRTDTLLFKQSLNNDPGSL